MLFSSIPFLFYFLPCVVILYFAAPKRLKNSVILISSLFFYGWGEPKYLIFMLISIMQGYIFGLLIEKYRNKRRSGIFLTASVFISLGLLFYCKYADFFIDNFNKLTGLSVAMLNIALPVGISFYTFQILSYAVDVYRGHRAQKNFINLATYVAMFPQLIAGPIVRYSDIENQLESRSHSLESISIGIRRFILGLSKKVLIANVLGELVDIFKNSNDKSVAFFWLYAVAYTLHIYFDFSGYSDMAIGLGRIFGFKFIENFNYPYISKSITEFWRRWHISLGSWFRDYVYIPLGGNRVGKLRWLFNILVVWCATGLWHGAAWNFVVWGLMFAVLLMLEKLWLLSKLESLKILPHIYTMLFVILGFVVFDAADISSAGEYIGSMFGVNSLSIVTDVTLYYLKSYAVIIVLALLGCTPLPARLVKKAESTKQGNTVINICEPIILTALLVVCTAYLIDGSFNPFLYFRF